MLSSGGVVGRWVAFGGQVRDRAPEWDGLWCACRCEYYGSRVMRTSSGVVERTLRVPCKSASRLHLSVSDAGELPNSSAAEDGSRARGGGVAWVLVYRR